MLSASTQHIHTSTHCHQRVWLNPLSNYKHVTSPTRLLPKEARLYTAKDGFLLPVQRSYALRQILDLPRLHVLLVVARSLAMTQ